MRVYFDLSKPLIGHTGWVRGGGGAPADTETTLTVIDLPNVTWTDQAPVAVAYYDAALGQLHVAIEFDGLAFSSDWLGDRIPERLTVADASFEVIVPEGTTILVTDVVADHFSKYYRWRFNTERGAVVGDFEPRTVFTN